MILSIRKVTDRDEDTGEPTTGYRLANEDGKGYGDVVRAVAMTGWDNRPRSRSHPALCLHDTREEAVTVAESLGAELSRRLGGALEIV